MAKLVIINTDFIIDNVIFSNYLSASSLKHILKQSKVSLMPSVLYESFGLTIIESILSGCIPLANDIGALSETSKKFGGFSFKIEEGNLLKILKIILLDYETHFKNLAKNQQLALQDSSSYLKNILKIYL